MGPKRDAEDLPRLLAALGLDGPGGFDARAVDRASLTAREQAGLDHWVPTRESLARVADRRRNETVRAEDGPGEGARSGRHRRPEPAVSVVDVPVGLRGAHHRVGARTVAVALVVVLVAVALFAVRVVQARAAATPRPVGTSGGTSGPDASARATTGAGTPSGVVARATTAFGPEGATPAAAGVATAGPNGGTVMVHVVGQVRRPGVVRLAAGSRVADAVQGAGGSTARADLASVNLARVVVDGEQIRVPRPGETVSPAPSAGSRGSGGPASSADTSGGLVNLNTADLAGLDTLPGVGPVLAQRILDWRAEHGRFTSVDELGEVSGIGEKMLAQLTPKVTV